MQYLSGSSPVEAVDTLLTTRETVFESLRKNLLKAQAQMKHFANKNRREIYYTEGDWVLVKLCAHR